MWTHHIKRLILENHHAIIPQKVRVGGQALCWHGGHPHMARGERLHPNFTLRLSPPQAKEAILEMDLFCECHQQLAVPSLPSPVPSVPQRHPPCPQTPRACPAAAPST